MEEDFEELDHKQIDWTEDPITKNIFFITESIIAILATIGNGLVIFAFIKEPSLRRGSNFYIISLTCADFLVGLVGIPFGVLSSFIENDEYFEATCFCRMAVNYSLSNISISSIMLISIKRYVTLSNTVPHRINIRKMAKEIAFCWILGIILGCVPLVLISPAPGLECLFSKIIFQQFFILTPIEPMVIRFICILLLIIIYFKIYRIILNQIKNEKRLRSPSDDNERKATQRERKTTITFSVIVATVVIGCIPINVFTVLFVLYNFCETCRSGLNYLDILYLTGAVCAHSVSAINPIIYAYNIEDVRKVMFNFKKTNLEPSDSENVTIEEGTP